MCSKNNPQFREMLVLLQPLNLLELISQVKHYPSQFIVSTTMKMFPRDENTISNFQRLYSLIIIKSIVKDRASFCKCAELQTYEDISSTKQGHCLKTLKLFQVL